MTIINPGDMTRHYLLWGVSLGLVITFATLMYGFHPDPVFTTPLNGGFGVIKPILAGAAGLFGVLALSFKFVFAQEMVAWVLLQVIALCGTVGIGLFGYHELWLLYYVGAFAGLFILGPYLHFD